ncbi:MAG: DNA-processing protein DprA [Syntrophorhabdaceae bacterium]|nr:DNA-processing protein DprA [Syntrophorhabdaceae bacterium]
MNIQDSSSPVCDTLLRLSLTEGFTVAGLRRLQKFVSSGKSFTGVTSGGRDSLYLRAYASLSSEEAKHGADAVREACARSGVAILSFMSDEYPKALKAIPDAPLVLYRAGVPWREGTSVAVVGSRAPTDPGARFARLLAADLAAAGCVVVSGMARGIDAAAHWGALSAGGKTVAVMGCGLDMVYPPEHAKLKKEIAGKGTLFSEYPPGSQPMAHRFPARNRIVSGICRAVIVAEAPERSGALITARLALEQGREVMAVPGNPWFTHTAGSNRLLRDGASLACSAADVLGALGVCLPASHGKLASRILDFLDKERHAEEIASALSVKMPELLAALMELELTDLVVKRTGSYYKRKS